MSFTTDQKTDLAKPLQAGNVASRTQSGRKLSYLEGWHVIAEANRIFGFDGWTRETVEMREVRTPELVKSAARDGREGKETWRVGFIAKVRVTACGIVREGTGYGSGALPDLGEAYESAVKEAETDAMKRALMTFGNQFGLALYDKDQENVTHAAPAVHAEPAKLKPSDPALKLFAKLSLDLQGQPTAAALTAWITNPVVEADYADLPAPLQGDLKKAIAKKREDLAAVA